MEKSTLLRGVWTAGSVVDFPTLDRLPAFPLADSCDIVEFRADAFPDNVPLVLARMRECPVPCLLTVRAPEEGGLHPLSGDQRAEILEVLLPAATLVDVEVANLRLHADLLSAARARGVTVVGSFHDFRGTPGVERLRDLSQEAITRGADLVKFATTLQSARDLSPLVEMLETASPLPVSAMGMGPLGRVSRLLCARLGSVLNYGYLDRPTVPGQWPASVLRERIRELQAE